MSYSKLLITYTHQGDDFVVPYTLRNSTVVPKWIALVERARQLYPIDDPERFYGFGSLAQQTKHALEQINGDIHVINAHSRIIERTLLDVHDQDTLNYLHHIFEEYHGLLDQQTHDYWQSAPDHVRQALADLNVAVHRCESVARGTPKRHVVTWYGMPKTQHLQPEDFACFEPTISPGTAYLNYVEIGKTIWDLMRDHDEYIDDDAFRPWDFYSADFNVQFWTLDARQAQQERAKIREYYAQRQEFFEQLGWAWGDPQLEAQYCPLADIDDIGHLDEIDKRGCVKDVTFR